MHLKPDDFKTGLSSKLSLTEYKIYQNSRCHNLYCSVYRSRRKLHRLCGYKVVPGSRTTGGRHPVWTARRCMGHWWAESESFSNAYYFNNKYRIFYSLRI